jgi:hypothetical protein
VVTSERLGFRRLPDFFANDCNGARSNRGCDVAGLRPAWSDVIFIRLVFSPYGHAQISALAARREPEPDCNHTDAGRWNVVCRDERNHQVARSAL